jgi:hypothetical protein
VVSLDPQAFAAWRRSLPWVAGIALGAVLGSFVSINVVGAELMVALMDYGHEQAQTFASGLDLREYDQRIEQLHAAGLTKLSTRSARPGGSAPPPATTPGSRAARSRARPGSMSSTSARNECAAALTENRVGLTSRSA